jgi:7-carboxy-7-deazaguanine synthase
VTDKEHKYPIIELFGPTIQGEGLLLGVPTHFLRFGGCSYNCSWCDSMHAVDPKQIIANRTMMTIPEIMRRLNDLPEAPWVTFTGGDPCIHKGLDVLIGACNSHGMLVNVETQGEMWPEWLEGADCVTFSPKGPSSGNITEIDKFVHKLFVFRGCSNARIAVKVVVFDEADLAYAQSVYYALEQTGRPYQGFYYQVGSPIELPLVLLEQLKDEHGHDPEQLQMAKAVELGHHKRESILALYESLTASVLKSGAMNALTHITPQMHVLLWPNEEKGR